MTQQQILEEYKKAWQADMDGFILQIGQFPSIRAVIVQKYYDLCKEGKCTRIEELPQEEKLALWQEAKRISAKQEENYLKEVCRALQGFGMYIQQ